jgi:hypothetical protein
MTTVNGGPEEGAQGKDLRLFEGTIGVRRSSWLRLSEIKQSLGPLPEGAIE